MNELFNIEICIFSMIVLLLIHKNYSAKVSSGRGNIAQELFVSINVFTFIISFVLIIQLLINGQYFPNSIVLNKLLVAIFYILLPVPELFWMLYVIYKITLDESRLRRNIIPVFIPYLANFIICAIGIFNDNVLFYINGDNLYKRSGMFYITPLVMILYLVLSMIIAAIGKAKNRIKESNRFYVGIILMPLIPLCAILLEGLLDNLTIILPATAITLLVLCLRLQNRNISTDGLTKLYNRKFLRQYVDSKISSNNSRKKFFIIIIDVDKFKQINDNFGHTTGDEALISVANILRKSYNQNSDIISRIGGDEFVITGLRKDESSIEETIQKINSNIERFNKYSKSIYKLSLSCGYAVFNTSDCKDLESFIAKADKNMYLQKSKK